MSNGGQPSVTVAPATRGLTGTIRVPGDKSITHRLALLAAVNNGVTHIVGPSQADDPRRSLELVAALGCGVAAGDDWRIDGRSRRTPPEDLVINCGNSGTTARVGSGLLAAEPGTFTIVGDHSLSGRPMSRVVEPLRRIGANISATDGHLPMRIEGRTDLDGGESHGVIPVASAQVHAALALAGLRSRAGVTLFRGAPMRDHTLRLLRAFGASVATDFATVDRILPSVLEGDRTFDVPGDFSSAAFLIVAATLVPNSDLTITGVGLNPTRTGLIEVLNEMGADMASTVESDDWEPVGTVRVRTAARLDGGEMDLRRTDVLAGMIDELPLLALVATQAHGRTVLRGASELRVKESDRISATVAILRGFGAKISELPDGFIVDGPCTLHRASVDPRGDHRMAMMGAIAALVAGRPATISDAGCVDISWPGFWNVLAGLVDQPLTVAGSE